MARTKETKSVAERIETFRKVVESTSYQIRALSLKQEVFVNKIRILQAKNGIEVDDEPVVTEE